MNLTQLVTDARTKEFGDDTGTEQFPSQFFNHSVTVAAPNGQTTPRNPRFCATNFGARRLAEALNQYNDPRLQMYRFDSQTRPGPARRVERF